VFKAQYAAASEAVKDQIDALMRAIVDEPLTGSQADRLEHSRPLGYTRAVGDVLIAYSLPADHPWIIFATVIWP